MGEDVIDRSGAEELASPADYSALIDRYHEQGLTDGNPVIPITEDGLQAMIAATGRPGAAVIGAFPGKRAVTIKDVAENALMAGCLPAYMPIVMTAFEIILDPSFPSQLFYDSTGSFFPFLVVNGPIREEIFLNCRPNVFGPGFRPNATIGRALRLGLINLADARIGAGDRSALGTAYKFTCVIGEDEEATHWEPLHVQLGFSKNADTVTVFAAWQPRLVTHQLSVNPEHLLATFAEDLATSTQFNPLDGKLPAGISTPKAIVVVGDDHRGYFANAGWTRRQMQEFLHSVTTQRAGTARDAGFASDARLRKTSGSDAPVHLYDGPDDFLIMAAGSGGGRTMIGGSIYHVTREISPAAVATKAPEPARGAAPRTTSDYVAIVNCYIDGGATDGWPVIPPDASGVARLVEATGRDPKEELGVAPWRMAPVTVQDVAINAMMAGCWPQHIPLVMSVFDIMLAPENANGLGMAASTYGYAPLQVFQGRMVAELGLNSGAGLFGPGSRANATIGRAIRLGLMNLMGYRPNLADRSCLGQAFKYGCVIADDEVSNPWEPLCTTLGFAAGDNVVTHGWIAHPRLTLNDEAKSPEELLRSIAEDMSVIQYIDSPSAAAPDSGTAGSTLDGIGQWIRNRYMYVVMSRGHVEILRRAGWSRLQTQEFLSVHNRRKVRDARAKGFGTSPFVGQNQSDDDWIERFAPDKIVLITAGGPCNASMSIFIDFIVSKRLAM